MRIFSQTRLRAMLMTIAGLLVIGAGSLMAQDLNNGATGTIVNKGTIKFSDNNGAFLNANTDADTTSGSYAVDNRLGSIEFAGESNTFGGAVPLGATALTRVSGTVTYSTTNNQNIYESFYTNLVLDDDGRTLEFPDAAVYCSHEYIPGASNTRNYNSGTFIYDSFDNSYTQYIASETGASGGSNIYNALSFENEADKVLASGNTANIQTEINFAATSTGGVTIQGTMNSEGAATIQNSLAPVTIDGVNGEFVNKAGAATFDGTVTVSGGSLQSTGAGQVTFDGNNITTVTGSGEIVGSGDGGFGISNGGLVTITSGSFTLSGTADATVDGGGTLALTDENGIITLYDGRTLNVAGDFTNGAAMGSRTNMEFVKTSNVHYNGNGDGDGQIIVGTDQGHPYGNLLVSADAKTDGSDNASDGEVNVYGNLSVSDNNLAMGATNPLVMLDHAGTVTYASGIEVEGQFRRYFNYTGGYAGAALTYNNSVTTVTITDNSDQLTHLTLDMTPDEVPTAGQTDYDADTDLKRKILYSYTGTDVEWASTVQIGYKDADLADVDAAGNKSEFLETVRYREGDGAAGSEKVSTGVSGGLIRSGAAADGDGFYNVSLAGVRPVGGAAGAGAPLLAEVTSGHDLLLRGGPTIFYTINHGRWSNPDTWDEGIQPGPNDEAVVQHVVHVGFRRELDAGANPETGAEESNNGKINEYRNTTAFTAPVTRLTSKITIIDPSTYAGSANSALIFGTLGTGSADEQTSAWIIDETISSLDIQNPSAANTLGLTNIDAADLNSLRNGALSTSTAFQGLIILNGASLNLKNLTNVGPIGVGSGSTLEIGQ